jgi:hypothetical protein
MISDRSSGRVESFDRVDHPSQASRHPSAKESLGRRKVAPARVTDASVRRMAAKLTDLDRSVLETLSIVRIATGAQLRQLHWADTDTGRRMARHHLAKLTDLRLLARLDRRIGGVRAGSDGYTYALDVAGLRVVSESQDASNAPRTRRPTTPGDRYLAHALAITDAYVTLHDLTTSTELDLLVFEAEPASWRSYPGPAGQPLTIKPDAFVLLADTFWEHRWFLEIDRATEHRPTILRKAKEYLTYWQSGSEQRIHDLFPKVLWIVPTERRALELHAWLTELEPSAGHIFDVCTAANFGTTISTTEDSGGAS